jgi:hypothetical protein
MIIGFFQLGIYGVIFSIIIGSLKKTPFISCLIVTLGLVYFLFKLNSITLVSSAVIVAHFIATSYFFIASIASFTILSSVFSLFSNEQSK